MDDESMGENLGQSDDLTDAIASVIEESLSRGMVAPLIIAIMDRNGSLLHARVSAGTPEYLAEHMENPGFEAPVTMVVLDQRNSAAKIVFDADRITFH